MWVSLYYQSAKNTKCDQNRINEIYGDMTIFKMAVVRQFEIFEVWHLWHFTVIIVQENVWNRAVNENVIAYVSELWKRKNVFLNNDRGYWRIPR